MSLGVLGQQHFLYLRNEEKKILNNLFRNELPMLYVPHLIPSRLKMIEHSRSVFVHVFARYMGLFFLKNRQTIPFLNSIFSRKLKLVG